MPVFACLWHSLGYNFYGWLSDITGRKRLTQYYCVFLILFGVPVYYVLYNAAIARNIKLALLGTTMAAMLKSAGASYLPTFLNVFRQNGGQLVSDWVILRAHFWEHGLAFMYGGHTVYPLSQPSRNRICGFPPQLF